MRRVLIVGLLLGVLFVAACGGETTPTPATVRPATATAEGLMETPPVPSTPTPSILESPLATAEEPSGILESPIGLPNPASQFCEEQGYALEIREEAGGSVGYCLFPDGSECEEWAFFRDECKPGTSP